MGFFDKLMSMVRMDEDPEDDYDDVDDYGDSYDDDYEEVAPAKKSARRTRSTDDAAETKSRRSSAKKKYDDDKYEDESEDEDGYSSPSLFSRKKVVPMKSAGSKKMEVCSIKPTSMDDSQEIVDTLLSGRAVVLNLGSTADNRVAQSIVDFTCGACYAIGGTLRPVSQYIFLITPRQVNMTGDFLEDGESNYNLKSFPKDEL